mgnify:CR=1 FL=1
MRGIQTLTENALALSILNSLNTRIAVIDDRGEISLVNHAWVRFAQESGDPDSTTTGIGVNYLIATQRAMEAGDESAEPAFKGIHAVLNGSRPQFELKYPCHSPTEEHWYLMRVTPLVGGGGAVIAHIDITAQHFAARSQTRHALQAEDRRRSERERAALEVIGMDADDTLRAEADLVEGYMTLLNAAIERRALKVERTRDGAVRSFAMMLARQSAGPRDLVRLHTKAIAKVTAEMPLQKRHVILEEARLLLLEVMGSLAGIYRDMILANLELKNM